MTLTAQETADLVTFTEKILDRKLHCSCSAFLRFMSIKYEILTKIRDLPTKRSRLQLSS